MKNALVGLKEEEKVIFERQLNREILFSEKLRVTLLGSAYLFFFVVFVSLTTILRSQVRGFVLDFTPIYIASVLFVVFAAREFILRATIDKVINGKLNIDYEKRDKFRYANTVTEMSVPTLIMIVFAIYFKSNFVFSTPVVLLYMIMIMLTTLSLNYKMSIVAGATAAIEFLITVLYFINTNGVGEVSAYMNEPYIYIAKSFLLLSGGVIAAIIAYQLRKRIYNSYAAIFEHNRIVNLFGQQVSQQIVDELIAAKDENISKRKFVCIMFLDIRGFTPYAEKREPEEIIAYQNEVFGFMIDAITKNNGVINQFLGDGYMATFGAPVSWGNDCQNAVNAALEIVKTLKEKNDNKEFRQTDIGIGLHAGYVVAGNVGTQVRKQYSITGNTVILASRIEQLNKTYKSQLLISEEVFNKVNNEEFYHEHLGEVSIKGREEPINIYKLQ